MENTNIRQLEDAIIDILNQSDVLIETKRLILADVLHIVTKEAEKEILNELRTKGENDDSMGKHSEHE